MRLVLYARKSEESDERQVQSLDDQARLARRKADELNHVIVEEILEAKSAKEPYKRDGFAYALSLIDEDTADGILAWHPDRLSRNEVDAAALTYRLRHQVLKDLVFVNYAFTNSPEGIMMLQMALSQSQYYSAKLGVDVRRGLESRLEKGWRPSPAPQGYLNNPLEHTIIPDPERFALIRKAWDLMLSGAYTVPQIVRVLDAEWGYLTRKTLHTGGGPLSRAALYRMLHNPFYCGDFVYGQSRYPGAHTPMVTKAEFERVQELLSSRGKQHPVKREFAFTGMIRCGNCGCMVTAEVQKGHTYYHCTNRRGICNKKGLRAEEIERQVEEILLSLELDPEFEAWCRDAARLWFEAERGEIQKGREQQSRAIAEAESELAELLKLRLRKLITDDLYKHEAENLKETLKSLKQYEQEAASRFDQALQSVEHAVEFSRYARETFQNGGIRAKRLIAQALGSQFVLTDGTILPELHPLLTCIVKLNSRNSPDRTSGTGSGKQKRAIASSRVPIGGTAWTIDELCQVALAAPFFLRYIFVR